MSTSLVIPKITTTLLLTNPINIVVDLNTIWMNAVSGPVAVLANAVSAADTTITVGNNAGIAVGSVVLADNEPLTVTAINGNVITVIRSATEFAFLQLLPTPQMTTHAAGTSLFQMTFPSPWVMLQSQAIRPWVQPRSASGLPSQARSRWHSQFYNQKTR